uniref:Adenosine deaminase RNA specific B1a n=1 Tax=Cynoglossus semilaevis TaxID=244447 RepID=A0A3P8V7U3_CYNSE
MGKSPTVNADVVAKRKHPLAEGNSGHPYKPRKRKTTHQTLPPKNALIQLNDIRQGLQYKLLSQTGPVHAPEFVMSVEVNGQLFKGSGPTKQKAKQRAAEAALHSPLMFKPTTETHVVIGRTRSDPLDFTTDRVDFQDNFYNTFENCAPSGDNYHFSLNRIRSSGSLASSEYSIQQSQVQKPNHAYPSPCSSTLILPRPKTPAMILNELVPDLKYTVVSESGKSHDKNFVVSVTVDAHSFQGSGRNKRLAKARAAQAALSAVFNIRPCQTPSLKPEPREGPQLHPPQALADTIYRLVNDKFNKLSQKLTSQNCQRKVLAGVVMSTGADPEAEAQVICVSTGTKCIEGEYLSDRGLALNDCHAEVIARRSLIRFLFSQLELFLHEDQNKQQKSIFIKGDEGQGFRLKENIQFHLYISSSPCGDARIFSPHEATAADHGDKTLKSKTRGQLRTKIESAEGTVPVRPGGTIQTWDGILQGDRLLTMSCSDKIARWNVVGLQGSLLTYFTEPIYFCSIILGSLYHCEHLCRAMYQRVGEVEELPPSFTFNRPLLSGISDVEARHPGKAANSSLNWTLGDEELELIDAITGRDDMGQPSRLCKHALYSRWMNLHCKLFAFLRIKAVTPSSYYEAKKTAVDYHSAKKILFKAFHKAGLGVWVKKPKEQDQFSLYYSSQ